ncbi:hypothetical protein ACOSQ3_033218 [Xanthoceras sorbifolium]
MWGRRFLFESCWAGTEDCLTLIKSSWTGGEAEDSIQKVLGKLGRYAKDLDMWNQQKSRHLRKQLQKLRKEMTTFFHYKASQRRKKNDIKGLFDEDGSWHTDDDKVAMIVVNYFDKKFSSTRPDMQALEAVLSSVERKVNDNVNAMLDQDFTVNDIKAANNQMHPTKAPSPDGMSALFYQKYWDVLTALILSFFVWCGGGFGSIGTRWLMMPVLP